MIEEKKKGKPRIKAIDRKQLLIVAVDVERLVAEDHPVRVIWQFVGQLDLRAFYEDIQAVEGEAGRAAFDPHLLISLWLYAYSKGIGSAREISRLCEYDPAFQWLTALKAVNYHTIADFRVMYEKELDELFKNSLAVLASEDLIDLKRVFQDGSKVWASAGSDSFHRKDKIVQCLELAEEVVQTLKESDDQVNLKRTRAIERAARERKELLQKALQEFKKLPKTTKRKKETRTSVTDPDARMMKGFGGAIAPAYNAQVSVESKNGFIVGAHIAQSSNDFQQLSPGMQTVSDFTGTMPQEAVVDSGYTSKRNIIDLAEKGTKVIGPLLPLSPAAGQFDKRGIDADFRKDAFLFDQESNCYVCPAGKTLSHVSSKTAKVSIEHLYEASATDCLNCHLRQKCCGTVKRVQRRIVRSEELPAVIEFNQRMQSQAAKMAYRERSSRIEFAFAWIKEKLGLRKFHLRSLRKVKTELLWVCLTYNVQQWIRIRKMQGSIC